MGANKIKTSDEAEAHLTHVFEILDSYAFDRFPEVFASNLEYQGGLQKDSSLEDFTTSLKKSLQAMPAFKTSHSRWKNDIMADGTIYSHGHSTAHFGDTCVTIPMLGVFSFVNEGAESGKIKYMAIYKDRVPFLPHIQKLPGMGK